MIRPAFLTAAGAAIAWAALVPADVAEARKDRHHSHDEWRDRWENRRDARRAGIVAGVVASSVTRAATQERVEQRYADCVYATGYDYECERRRYYDERQARQDARRTGVVVGLTARAIVRD